VVVQIVIVGRDLPGRSFCDADGNLLADVHVGVQVRRDADALVPGDAASARWALDVKVSTGEDGQFDFSGPAVHGKRGERFLYLTWGNVSDHDRFEMFRRAKLMLNRIDPGLVEDASTKRRPLVATVQLSDDCGAPRCARVDPPALRWSLG
jgi:hypothetical protein